jgi:nucleotide-binding universal stress UspA family protein
MIRHILFATDGTAVSERAAEVAVSLAQDLRARITALYVTPPRPQAGGATLAVEEVQALAKAAGVECAVAVEPGAPWEAILKAAMSYRPDMIAMAPHGGETQASAVIDGDTTRVVANTRIPVLLCH